MARFAAFLDACVLVPIAPCDTLLRLADAGTFRPLWSERVMAEVLSALERVHPQIDRSRFQGRIRSMKEAFDDALVEGWEPLEQGIVLPDPGDRHVVAAAVRSRADMIVAENLKDFPRTALDAFGLEATRVEDFILDQFDLSPDTVTRIIAEQAAAMARPPVDTATLLARLVRSGVLRFAMAVAEELRSGAH